MSKKIIIFAPQLMQTGGMESHILSFCEKMAADGFIIDLVVPRFEMKDTEVKKLSKVCNRLYINKNKLSSSGYLLWMISLGLRLAVSKYQCLYTNGQGNSINLIAKLVFRREIWVHHHHSSGDPLDQEAWSAQYRDAMKEADVIIACSTRNAKDMSEALKRDIETIPCFSRKIKKIKTKANEKIRLGYYGRLIPEKGIEILAKLSDDIAFKEIEFHVWGQGVYTEEYFDTLENLSYHGPFYSIEALEEVINYLDAFLLISSHREGLPICLLEAMSAGLPWIASDKGGISDILCDPYATRLIRGDLSYEKIKTTVLDFVQDLNNDLVSSEKQINYYEENFSSNTLAARWGDLMSKKI
jgi:glycosyltransferase involved in cell wall biosynthesis